MAKQTITPIDLAQKYLIKLGIDPLLFSELSFLLYLMRIFFVKK